VFFGFQITSLLYSSISCITHSIPSINTEPQIRRTRTGDDYALQLCFVRSWEATAWCNACTSRLHHCTACRPFDATGKDRQVSEQVVAYHRINIWQRNDDTGYRPHWYDTEIRNKSGPAFKCQHKSLRILCPRSSHMGYVSRAVSLFQVY
jgi:hypothetical protein